MPPQVSATQTFSDPQSVEAMVTAIEGLTRVPRGAVFACPAETFESPTVEVQFRELPQGEPLATVLARDTGCDFTVVTLAGQKETVALFTTAPVFAVAERLLGVKL